MQPEDFYTLDVHNAGKEVELNDEDGNPTGCFLLVAGPDSDVWRDALAAMQRDALMASFADVETRTKGARRAEYLSRAGLGWRGFKDADGKPAEFDRKRIEKAFVMAPYVADQIDKFVAKRGNFTKPPVKR